MPDETWDPESWRSYSEAKSPYRQYKQKRDKRLAVELLNLRKGERLLEVGCGYGRISCELLKSAPVRLTGMDPSWPMMLEWKRGLPPGTTACLGDAHRLPFQEGTFDAALCTGVLMHLKDPAAAVKELVRVLRSGGRLVMSANNLLSPFSVPMILKGVLRPEVRQTFKTPSFYLKRLARGGMKIQRFTGDTLLAVGAPWGFFPLLRAPDRWIDRWPLKYLGYEIWFAAVKSGEEENP